MPHGLGAAPLLRCTPTPLPAPPGESPGLGCSLALTFPSHCPWGGARSPSPKFCGKGNGGGHHPALSHLDGQQGDGAGLTPQHPLPALSAWPSPHPAAPLRRGAKENRHPRSGEPQGVTPGNPLSSARRSSPLRGAVPATAARRAPPLNWQIQSVQRQPGYRITILVGNTSLQTPARLGLWDLIIQNSKN